MEDNVDLVKGMDCGVQKDSKLKIFSFFAIKNDNLRWRRYID